MCIYQIANIIFFSRKIIIKVDLTVISGKRGISIPENLNRILFSSHRINSLKSRSQDR